MNGLDLIKSDGTIYRVLAIKEKILVIDCITQKMPFWADELIGVPITEQELQIETGYSLPDIQELSPDFKRKAYERYTTIAVIDDRSHRNFLIEYASNTYKLSKQTILALHIYIVLWI